MKGRFSSIVASSPMALLRLLGVKTWRELKRFAYRRVLVCFGIRSSRASSRRLPSRPRQAYLRQIYQTSPARELADTFVLYRIIGNDLVPRHAKGQSRENVAFPDLDAQHRAPARQSDCGTEPQKDENRGGSSHFAGFSSTSVRINCSTDSISFGSNPSRRSLRDPSRAYTNEVGMTSRP